MSPATFFQRLLGRLAWMLLSSADIRATNDGRWIVLNGIPRPAGWRRR